MPLDASKIVRMAPRRRGRLYPIDKIVLAVWAGLMLAGVLTLLWWR